MTSPGRGLDMPLTRAPQAPLTRRARPRRLGSERPGRSSRPARKSGKSAQRSSRDPPQEMNQMTHVMMSWQYVQKAVRWFPVVSASGG